MSLKAEFYQSPGELARCVCLDKKTDFKEKKRQIGRSSALTSELSPLGVELLFSSFNADYSTNFTR